MPLLWLIISARIVSNPLSNVFQKLLTRRSADSLFIIFAVHVLLSIVCLPILLIALPPLSHAFWMNMIAVGLLTVSGNALLVQAVKQSDLSVLGPVNAYKSVVSLVPGMILLHEIPGPRQLAGIALIVAGSYFIVDKKLDAPRQNVFVRFFADRGIQYRFAALVLAAIEAVYLKRALLVSSALTTFIFWAFFGFIASLFAVLILIRRRVPRQIGIVRANVPTYMMLQSTTGIMQFCTILTFSAFQVGSALALFQTSALISLFLGYRIFRERNILERLIGSLVMVAGALLIVMGRT